MAAKIDFGGLNLGSNSSAGSTEDLVKILDLVNKVLPALQGGKVDIGQLLGLVLPLLLPLLLQLLAPKPVAPTAPSPTPFPPKPKVDEEDEGEPLPAPTRSVATVTAKYFWVAEDNVLKDKDTFDAIVDRQTPVREGARICVDATPRDQFGREIAPGSADLERLLLLPDGTPRLAWFVEGGIGRITGGERDFGCTPKVKVDRESLADNQDAEVGQVYGVLRDNQGNEVLRTNTLPSLRAKGEANR